MKRNFVLAIVLAGLSATAAANEVYHCSNRGEERTITLKYHSYTSTLPCRAIYHIGNSDKLLLESATDEAACEAKVDEYVTMHEGWGWQCHLERLDRPQLPPRTAPQAAVPGSYALPGQDIESYKRAAAFAQARMAAGPIKSRVIQYYQEEGKFPNSLNDIGMRRDSMRNSSIVDDLRIGYVGRIYLKGNATLGPDAAIVLIPASTLGGSVYEWACQTNVRDMDGCRYRADVRFE